MDDAHGKSRIAFAAAEAGAAGNARKLAALSRLAARTGPYDRAYPLARAARMAAPGDPEIAAITAATLTDDVAGWHFAIVSDARRNDAYEAAIRRAVTPGCRVLDIGAGTGLLGMMAARAGAGAVVSCEMNPAVADAAIDIVAANGLSDRVCVIAKSSIDLDVVEDMGGAADLLVSEIVSNDVLGQDVLAVMTDAVDRGLLKPGGRMIPASATALVALAEWSKWDTMLLDTAAGFDVSRFNRLRKTPQQVASTDQALTLRSAPAALYDFDFTRGGDWPAAHAEVDVTATAGRANGVLLWMRLHLDAETVYEIKWGQAARESWTALFFPLAAPITCTAGDRMTIAGRRDDKNIVAWVA